MAIRTLAPRPQDTCRIVPVIANWSASVRESYEFRTDIIAAFDGKEQRRSVRENPRRTFEFEADVWGGGKVALDSFMALSVVNKENLLPDPTRKTFLSSNLSTFVPPSTSVQTANLREPLDELRVGEYVIFDLGDGAMEALKVQSIAGNTLSLVEQTTTPIPAGTPVYASLRGYLRDDPQVQRRTKSVVSMRIGFDVEPGTYVAQPSSDASYVGWREAFTKKPDWSQGIDVQHLWPRETVDYGFGKIHHFVARKFPSRVTKMNYVGKSRSEVKQARDFFMRHFGRRKEFLIQSWEDDIPYQFIGAGSKSILLPGSGFFETYGNSSIFKRIVLNMVDGTHHHREVDFVEYLPDTNTSVLWLKTDLPSIPLNRNTMFGISWVFVSRFASDKMEIEWHTSTVAEFSMATQVLENFDI